ncbi:fasciculation and elongation protein zeta-2 [Periophthalmus magnuspinnatus]|uniref:fasciculation and elongation protein zeta-2 n=1 Tax=Periophthalmus magnuspinnatus TaxID=409849 RepID=UPI00145AC6F7|nr:fasciculation and elongation protein zeta-2 [Periophthalmus magnuspinnatus]
MAAPIAHFDDDWPNGGELSLLSGPAVPQKGHGALTADVELLQEDELRDCSLSPGECGTFKSMEDLVKDFDEKLTVCFQNYNARTESIAPVNVLREDALLERDEIWTALTHSYSQVMPVDWKQSVACSLHTPAFNHEDKTRQRDIQVEVSDDEELREQLDMHSMIITSLTDEPLQTADQVIEEIEEMMQGSPDTAHYPSKSDLSMLSMDVQRFTSPHYEERIRTMTVAELNVNLEETEGAIRGLSEELVLQLALRDELDFEKEVKNSFISALIDIQNRQKEHREMIKRKKKLKGAAGTSQGARFSMEGLSSVIQNSFRQTFRGGCSEKQYLTTVIPYAKTGHPPSTEDLQVLTKILLAMRDDSDKVPSLLTDYILKVLCPT